MYGRGHALGERGLDEPAALARDPELPPQQRLRRNRAEATSTCGFTSASSDSSHGRQA